MFDFNLIEEFGWYSPLNSKKPNLNGVSRDHIISVSFGFKHGISPQIISHPANCKLIRHKDNQKKYWKCELTLQELLNKIEIFNNKEN